nr:Rieske 2Fe-2S domain-containing protein [Sphingomonas sp. Y57]
MFHKVMAFDDLVPGKPYLRDAEGVRFVLVREGEAVMAVSDLCTHAAAVLDRGRVVQGIITCPMHGARFDLRNGACVNAPYDALRVYRCRIVDGQVEVDVGANAD